MCGKHVTGTVFLSIAEKEYPDGEIFTILNVDLEYYEYTSAWGAAHLLAKSPLGTYFRLNLNRREGEE